MAVRWRRDQATQPTATERFAPHRREMRIFPDSMAEIGLRVNAEPHLKRP